MRESELLGHSSGGTDTEVGTVVGLFLLLVGVDSAQYIPCSIILPVHCEWFNSHQATLQSTERILLVRRRARQGRVRRGGVEQKGPTVLLLSHETNDTK